MDKVYTSTRNSLVQRHGQAADARKGFNADNRINGGNAYSTGQTEPLGAIEAVDIQFATAVGASHVCSHLFFARPHVQLLGVAI